LGLSFAFGLGFSLAVRLAARFLIFFFMGVEESARQGPRQESRV
jgi:hypothetical protein